MTKRARRDWGGLVDIEVVSGMAEDGPEQYRGFVTVRATAEDGSFLSGQLDPATLRKMALNFLGAAEAAEQDAVVMTLMVSEPLGLAPPVAAGFIHRMRDVRHRLHPDEDDRP